MNIVISIEHPAWSHQFRYIIKQLEERGDKVTVLAVDKDGDLELLEKFNIQYILTASSTGRNTLEKGWLFLKLCCVYTYWCKKVRADVLIGRLSPMMSVAALLCRKPHILYDDDEVTILGLKLARWFSTRIITPRCFYKDLGKKQVKVPMYKELYYLDKKHFEPNAEILKRYGIDYKEKYVLVRFISWKASHDFGISGMNDGDKLDFVKNLSKYARVYISSETPLTGELEGYRLKIPFEYIHHVIYYAQIVISDGATMASEAVVLGTHAIRLSPIRCGTFIEQEERYHLLKWFTGADKIYFERALKYVIDMLESDKLWEMGKEKREILLNDMVDCNEYFIREMDETLEKHGKG